MEDLTHTPLATSTYDALLTAEGIYASFAVVLLSAAVQGEKARDEVLIAFAAGYEAAEA
jgi:hypothetical protein